MLSQRVSKITSKLSGILQSPSFHFSLIAVGIGLRLSRYLQNCSFWLDESYVALEAVNRSWMQILQGFRLLPEQPLHPPLFLLLAKTSAALWGNHELALRLVPLLSGILALIFFYVFLKRYAQPEVIPLALGLFVFSAPLIRYSAELKPYSCDVMVSVLLLMSFFPFRVKTFTLRKALWWGLGGGLALWLSYASVFILSAIALVMAGMFWRQKDWRRGLYFSYTLFIWGASFLCLYLLSLSTIMKTGKIVTIYNQMGVFMPWPCSFAPAMMWLKEAVFGMLVSPGGFSRPILALFLLGAGSLSYYKDSKPRFFVFVLPGLLVLLAAAFHKYPFFGRMLLFLVPGMIILIARGCVFILGRRRKAVFLLGVILIGFLLLDYSRTVARGFIVQPCFQDNRPVMRKLNARYRAGDSLYLSNDAIFSFSYYAGQTRLATRLRKDQIIESQNKLFETMKMGAFTRWGTSCGANPCLDLRYFYLGFNRQGLFRVIFEKFPSGENCEVDSTTRLKFLKQARAWVYLSHYQPDEKDFILDFFDRHGKRLEAYEARGAALYLYDLTANQEGNK